jgi:hypothetical protein
MIPTCSDLELTPAFPDNATYWVPSRAELAEEGGIGYFHETWRIVGGRKRDIEDLLKTEQELVSVADRASADEHEFDVVAQALETQDLDDEDLTQQQREALDPHVVEADDPLRGLELGVSGLSHALACCFMFPAASCRGHADPHAWSPHPAVYFACRQPQASVLTPLLEQAGVGIVVDNNRGNLWVLVAPDIRPMMTLAALLLRSRDQFRIAPTRRPPRTSRDPGHQARLF